MAPLQSELGKGCEHQEKIIHQTLPKSGVWTNREPPHPELPHPLKGTSQDTPMPPWQSQSGAGALPSPFLSLQGPALAEQPFPSLISWAAEPTVSFFGFFWLFFFFFLQ